MKGVARFLGGDVSAPTPPVLQTRWTMPGAYLYNANYYWAAAVGRASNYQGAYLTIGTTDYIWFTVSGQGTDPGLSVPALAGMTGTVVALNAGDTGTTVATLVAAAASGVVGWTGANAGPTVSFLGPDAVDSPVTWDAAGGGELLGMRSSRYDAGAGAVEGPPNGAFVGQVFTAPAYDTRATRLDVYIGTGVSVDPAERSRWAIYSSSSAVDPTANSVLLYDFGQEPVTMTANGWTSLYVDPFDLLLLPAGAILWLVHYGSGTVTDHGFYIVGSAGQLSTFADVAMSLSTSTMPTDATVVPPAAWTGTFGAGAGVVIMARVVVEQAPFASQAFLHSPTDPLIVGAHITALQNVTVLPAVDAVLTQTTQLEISIGPVSCDGINSGPQMCVGAHGTDQPRMGLYVGADFSNPEVPDVAGATLVVDAGRMTGSVTNEWVPVPATGTYPAGSVITIELTHAGASLPSPTTIRYTDFVDWDNADPLDAPCDFERPAVPGVGFGPEVATLAPPPSLDPADPLVSPLPALATRPGNVGGTRFAGFCYGMVLVP